MIGLVSFATFLFYSSYLSALNDVPDPDSDEMVIVEIEKGSTADNVADLLYEKELIKSPFFFKLYLRQQGLANQLKAGRLVVGKNLNLKELVTVLVEGKSSSIPVTLLEGWTAKQIANHLESLGLTTVDDFMNCLKQCEFDSKVIPGQYLEGYLYPDTYFVDFSSYGDQIFIQRLINTFEGKLDAEDWRAIEKGPYSLEQIVIMASIVEREERNENERSTVAGILWNRFENGIGLGADATVLYALGRTSGGLTYGDLQVNSPYNTRKYRGLPPTPISNPSISSILAALYPKETDYFYYLHAPDGKIYYGKTLDEHNENKRKYLR